MRTGNLPTMMMRKRVMSQTTKKTSTHHPAQSADPSSLTIQRVGATRLQLQACRCISALGLRLRSHLKRSPSSPRLFLQSLGRPCPGSRWTFPSLLRECSIFPCFTADSYFCSNRVGYEFFSAATSGTSMDIGKAQDAEETEDAATSKAGMILQSCACFDN